MVLSGFHDYRTPRRASIHALAAAFVRLGLDTAFISTRFSRLSRRTGDSRLFLWDRANRVETVDGVRCFLWKTPFHPFASANPLVSAAMDRAFPLYARTPNATFDAMIADADYVVIESSVAAIFVRRIRRLNPAGRIIYFATDRLDTHGAHPRVQRELIAAADLIDHFSLRAPILAGEFGFAAGRLHLAEFGVHPPDFDPIGPNPYAGAINGVSVGSGLFDPDYFIQVAPSFPEVDFHVIGCGAVFAAPPNVHVHPEMPFRQTLAWLAHATFGIAPYGYAPGAEYVAQSSLKLAQLEYLAKPAVTAQFAQAGNPHRFGYAIGDGESMCAATAAAIAAAGTVTPRAFPTWDEVAMRVLEPENYPEIRLG